MEAMFLVQVIIPEAPPLELMFNVDARAKAVYRQLVEAGITGSEDENRFQVEVSDDYGQTLCVDRDRVDVIFLRDLSRVHQGQAEIQIMQARAQAGLQRKAQQDPALKLLTPNGPMPGMRIA